MKVMLLEIDSREKKMLISKLSAVGLLAMKAHKSNVQENRYDFSVPESEDETGNVESRRQRLEIYAETKSISKITKSIMKLARDGFLVQFPVRIISIRPTI